MKVFVTGATGTIGSAVAEKLKEAGHQVLGLARSDTAAAQLEKQGIQVHRGDLYDPDSLQAGVRQADAVAHTASPNVNEVTDFAALLQLWRQSLITLLSPMKGTNKIFVGTSGTAVYGDTGEQLVDERSPIDTTGPMAAVGELEHIVIQAAHEGVRSAIIRPPLVYGRGRSIPVLSFIQSIQTLGHGLYVPNMTAENSTVHVDDLADLYVRIINNAPSGEVYNAVGNIVSTKALTLAATYAAGVGGQMQAVSPQDMMQLGFVGQYLISNNRVSAKKAKTTLGWQPHHPSILDELQYGSYQLAHIS